MVDDPKKPPGAQKKKLIVKANSKRGAAQNSKRVAAQSSKRVAAEC